MSANQSHAEIVAALRRMAEGDFQVALSPSAGDPDLVASVNALARDLRQRVEQGRSLAWGDLSVDLAGQGQLVDLLKDVQANLRHMVWQARVAASGDLTQQVEAMGDLSEVFNQMLRGLREAREALLLKNEDLDAANARLQQLNKLKDEFLSVVSHDLRSPLTSIIGYAELMLDEETEPLPTAHRRALEAIRRAGNRQLELVNDLLDLASIESGRIRLTLKPGLVSEVLTESREMMLGYAGDRRSSIELSLPEEEPTVVFDRARILQVVNNLLSNAIKFTQPGEPVEVGLARTAAGEITVHVKDRGQGISSEELPLLFDRFAQASSKARKGMKGTGLGLAISKNIVELHGGRIWVESRLRRGSSFFFTMPLPAGSQDGDSKTP